jgi:Zn-dependent protease with chaperone function
MIELPAVRYDGQTSARLPVVLRFFDTGMLQVRGEGIEQHFTFDKVSALPRVGRLPLRLEFPDGAACEIEDHPDLARVIALLPGRRVGRLVHRLENRLTYIGITLALAIAVLFGVIQYGIPVAARHIAERIPVGMERHMGEQTLAALDEALCTPTTLPVARRDALLETFHAFGLRTRAPTVNILFRQCAALGPNAFTLPAGTIIFTDDLVNLSDDDRQLLGVLAHEIGHVHYRHTLRHLLSNSATALLLIMLTGDIGSASSLAATLPTLLVQSKFSRAAEIESDDYAIGMLHRANIDPAYLADLLERMTAQGGGDHAPGFLSTHPQTEARIAKLRNE